MGARKETSLTIRGPVAREDLAGLTGRCCSLLASTGAHVLVCDVGQLAADAVAVDALARLRLAATRSGARLRLRDVSPELAELLELMALTVVLDERS